MKCFLKGFAGALMVIIAYLLIRPMYCDYSHRAEAYAMITSVLTTRDEVARRLVQGLPASEVETDRELSPLVDELRVTPDGTLIFRGGAAGNVFVLVPSIRSNTVTWTCLGPEQAMPSVCRNMSSPH